MTSRSRSVRLRGDAGNEERNSVESPAEQLGSVSLSLGAGGLHGAAGQGGSKVRCV